MPYGSYILDLRLILVAEKAFCLTFSCLFWFVWYKRLQVSPVNWTCGQCLTWNLQLLDYINGFMEMFLLLKQMVLRFHAMLLQDTLALFFPNILGVPRGMLQWSMREPGKLMVNTRTRKSSGHNQDNVYGGAWRAGSLLNSTQNQRTLTRAGFQRRRWAMQMPR